MERLRVMVSGRVQGVNFRAYTRREAQRLGLRGHARNLADGTVEVVAEGERERLERLLVWLRHGPPSARVDEVTVQWFFGHYLAGASPHDPRFAPLEAPDLDGLAPAALLLAECDPLVDEGLAYADRLRAAGVPVALDLVRGVTHDFIKMGRALAPARTAQQWLADALQEAWQR